MKKFLKLFLLSVTLFHVALHHLINRVVFFKFGLVLRTCVAIVLLDLFQDERKKDYLRKSRIAQENEAIAPFQIYKIAINNYVKENISHHGKNISHHDVKENISQEHSHHDVKENISLKHSHHDVKENILHH